MMLMEVYKGISFYDLVIESDYIFDYDIKKH